MPVDADDAPTFDALFDRFTSTVVRLETLPAFDVGGEEARRIEAWRTGQPVPDRSVRTTPWLARIAVSTVVDGKSWRRVRVFDEPLTEYQRYQLNSYIGSQAAGEQIFIAQRAKVGEAGCDVWVFDAGQPGAYAAVMRYDEAGHWLGFDFANDASKVEAHADRVERVAGYAIPLNEFLAGMRNR